MRISPIYNNSFIYNKANICSNYLKASVNNRRQAELQNLQMCSSVAFSGLIRIGKDFSKPVDSAFFRDYPALMSAVNILKENFPNGVEILDYACSDGEEAVSLYALLGDEKEKFHITGIDINDDPINLANQGIYSLFGGGFDEFLMPGAKKTSDEKELSNIFYEIMEPSDKPDKALNNGPNFYNTLLNAKPKFRKELFFKLKDDVKNNFEFKTGDIFKIDGENPDKKVGAVFFRNAFYHLMNSNDGEIIFIGGVQNAFKKMYETEGDASDIEDEELSGVLLSLDEKQAIADEIVDKVYDKLEVGGVFVLGNSLNENIFIADEDTPNEDTVRFGDTKTYKDKLNILKKRANNLFVKADTMFIPMLKQGMEGLALAHEIFEEQADVRILKKTPVHKALERDERFKPVHYSSIAGIEEIKVPTVWVKVK